MLLDGWFLFFRVQGRHRWLPVTAEDCMQYGICVADGMVDGAFASEADALSAMLQFAIGIRDDIKLQKNYWDRKKRRPEFEYRIERIVGYLVADPTSTAPT